MWIRTLFATPRIEDARLELRAELREFSHDGLVQLDLDLAQGKVTRGSWDGCVLSYRRGGAGSVDSDRKGRRGNAFTRYWDGEGLDEGFVRDMVREALESRTRSASLVAVTAR